VGIHKDDRIGGLTRYYFGEPELVNVPDEVRKCVAFLAYKDSEGMKLAGTAFFVGVMSPTPDHPQLAYSYAVTAKHVIDAITKNSVDGFVYFRVNFKGDGAKLIASKVVDWRFHPSDRSVDVAVLPVPSAQDLDYLFYPSVSFATPEVIKAQGIGIGDEVFLVGLFVHHFGQERNIPILRVGNIAAMPEEKVQTNAGLMEAYLVEARSIGGLSGSPVFVNLSGVRTVGGTMRVGGAGFYLLGLMHGHWYVKPESDTVVIDSRDEAVNMGIAIVIPAQKILEVINQPEFEESRKKQLDELRKQNAPTPDSKASS
jgi:hypothetical protein